MLRTLKDGNMKRGNGENDSSKKTTSKKKPAKKKGRGTKRKPGSLEGLTTGWLRQAVATFYIPVEKIFSSNTQLAPAKTKTGRPYLYLSSAARTYKEHVKAALDENYGDPRGYLGDDPRIDELILIFLVKERRDTTNMVKTTEDALAEWLGLDDLIWDRVSLVRVLREDAPHEGIVAVLVSGSPGGSPGGSDARQG